MSQVTGKTIDLRPYLEDLERRICPEEETRLEQEWIQFADGNCRQEVLFPAGNRPSPPFPGPM